MGQLTLLAQVQATSDFDCPVLQVPLCKGLPSEQKLKCTLTYLGIKGSEEGATATSEPQARIALVGRLDRSALCRRQPRPGAKFCPRPLGR